MTTTQITSPNTTQSQRTLVIVAWVVMLLASALPNILRQELIQPDAEWSLLWAKLGLLTALGMAGLLWRPLGLLRPFILVLLLMFVAEELLVLRVGATTWWQAWFGGDGVAFTTEMMGVQLRRLAVALTMIAGLRVLGYSFPAMFLTRGQLDAPVTPVPLPGFPNDARWTRFGLRWAAYISLGTLVFLVIGGRPAPSLLVQVLPMLPLILLLAAMNAFSEEMTYRASLLAVLTGPLGTRHALWLSALFFGIVHYYGVPYGIVGVLMSTFLGWILGKAKIGRAHV